MCSAKNIINPVGQRRRDTDFQNDLVSINTNYDFLEYSLKLLSLPRVLAIQLPNVKFEN